MAEKAHQSLGSDRLFRIEPEQRVRLARAIAVRGFDEQQRIQVRLAELTGGEYESPNLSIKEAMISAGAKMNEEWLSESPTLPSDVQGLAATFLDSLDDNVFEEMIRDEQKNENDPVPITSSELRSSSKVIVGATLDSLSLLGPHLEDFTDTQLGRVAEAREMGVEMGVDPATIYADDELYLEFVKRTETPIGVAEKGIEMIMQTSPEKMSEMAMNIILAIIQTDELPMTQDEVLEMKQEISEDPHFNEMVKTETLKHQMALRILLKEQIVRFWGKEGLDSLPESLRTALIEL